MNKRFFFAVLGGASLAELYRARVLTEGGTIYDYAAVQAAYAKAAEWGLDSARTHWASPRFGNLITNGVVLKRFCLFGHDAVQSGATGWALQAGSKAPQHYTNKASFQCEGLPWANLDLMAHVICQPQSWQTDHYPYFPIVENSESPGQYAGFLLGVEQGILEAGYGDPAGYALAQDAGYPPTGVLTTLALQLASAAPTPRLFINARQATGAYTSTPPAATAYAQAPIFFGSRGGGIGFTFDGNINDVLLTNKDLPEAARLWLDTHLNAY